MDNIAQLGIKVDSSGIKQATNELSKLTNQSGKTEKGIDTLSAKTSILNAKNAVWAIATSATVAQLVKMSDTWTSISSRLNLATKSTEEYTKAQQELFKISQITRTGLEGTVDLYSRIARSTESLKLSQDTLLKLTETINKTGIISGATTQQMDAGLMQLGQAFSAGALRGEELNSILEQMPRLAKAIADGMNIEVGALKDVASQGKITSKVLIDAITSQTDSINNEFNGMAMTIDQASVTAGNSILALVGKLNDATGASTDAANSLKEFGEFLDTNSDRIIEWGIVAYASTSQLADGVKFLYNALHEGSLLIINGVITTVTGVLKPITGMLLSITESLHELGLSSDESLNKIKSINDSITNSFNESIQGSIKAVNIISGSYKDMTISAEDRIKMMTVEKQISMENAEMAKVVSDEQTKTSKKKIELTKEEIKALKDAQKAEEDKNKALLEIAQIGMSSYDKSISDITAKTIEWIKAGVSKNEVLSAEKKLRDELNYKNILENLQTELSYYEKKLQLQKDSLDKELELKGVQYANNILAIESSDKTIEQKQKLIALETDLYNATVERLKADNNAEFQDTIKSFQEDSLARQIELNNAIFDFGAGFKSSNSEIMEVSKSLAAMSDASLKSKKAETELNKKYTTEFNKYAGDVEKTKELEQQYTKDTDLLNKQAINNQIIGYANIAGAISGMFQQGSKEAATFQAVQTTLALVEGTRAILTAGTGDPYTAIPRMAAMSLMVKSLLGNIGVSLGMSGSNTTSGDSFSMQKANAGTGSVLGDSSKASDSITKSLSILEDYAKPEFRLSQQMSKSLESIDNKIGGVTSLLLQNSATALGTNYTGGFDTGFKNNISLSSMTLDLINPINSIISKIPIIGDLNNILGGVIDSALGGLFGKTSVKRTLQDSGITFADALLKDAITEFDGSVYQTISTKTTKKSWFGSSSKTKLKTYFTGLDDSISNQFSLVLRNLYDTVYQAGNALEIGSDSLNNSLNNFVVSIGKISLKDKTGTQIQELLTSIFGKIGDDLATSVVPVITQFQKVGEGTLTTLTRVANGMEQANYYIDRLGTTFQKINFNEIINKQGDVGFEALYQSILKVEKGANFNNILSTLSGTAEELYSAYLSLDLIRDRLTFLGKGLDGLSISAISGAGGLEQLSDGISSFIENFYSSAEQQQLKVSELNQELSRTGITTIPTTIAGFKELVNGIDTTTESGQKLYGSLISLSDSFYDVYGSVEESRTSLISSLEDFVSSVESTIQTDTTFKDFSASFNNMIDAIQLGSEDLSDIGNETINTAQSYLDTVARTAKSSAEIEFSKKIVANKFEGVINAEDVTLGTINDTLKISFNEDSAIVKALNDVKNELVYLNQLNTRQTANSNKTLQLQRASIA